MTYTGTGTPLRDCGPWVNHTGTTLELRALASEEEVKRRARNREWQKNPLCTSHTAYLLLNGTGKD